MKKKRTTRKERREKLEKLQVGWELVRLIRHFFPELMEELKGVTDQRHPSYTAEQKIIPHQAADERQ